MSRIIKKRTVRRLGALLLMLVLGISQLFALTCGAVNATAYTFTLSPKEGWIKTKDAYLVDEILFTDYNLSQPSDIYVRGDLMYIADTGNYRIVIYNMVNRSIKTIGEDVLGYPTGVYVTESGKIYVADNGNEAVYLFNSAGELEKSYPRPTTVTFGVNNVYKPSKVVADEKGLMYIAGEGAFDGIIQLDSTGEFLGYFGYNNLSLSIVELFQELFFTEEQKAKLFNRIPYSFSNVAIDKKGLVFSLTYGLEQKSLKKHNISGVNMLDNNRVFCEKTFVDLSVGQYGQIYAVTDNGLIYEYDEDGTLIFSFGGQALSSERNGLFTLVSGIAVDQDDCLYVLDKERGYVCAYSPTAFTASVHEALKLYESGDYEESRTIWEKILRESGSSKIVQTGIADCYLQMQDYEKAQYHYEIANDKKGYSDAYWEIRNEWLISNIGTIFIVIFLLVVAWKVITVIDRHRQILDPFRRIGKKIRENKYLKNIVFLKDFIKHPVDSFYDIRHDIRGSVKSATVIYVIAFVIFTWFWVGKGFVVNFINIDEVSWPWLLAVFFAPVALWIVSNYMVSSINEGEGRFRDVYIMTAYSFAPFILFTPFIMLFSYVATLNEVFLINFATIAIVAWVAALLFIGLRQVHDYEISEIIKTVLITVFFMCVMVVVLSMLQMFWDQIFELIYAVVKEVAYRVGG